jgi:NADPH-dependent 2,4-dienoyl-CoA reductase/sulfur reductase-like enzyme/nitrite reductase/ring-hydroxylating ferredoxin subunit
MSDAQTQQQKGPDFTSGVRLAELADGAHLLGHVGDEAVLMARVGEEIFAVDATCTHYGGPLAEGLMTGDTIRCPLHHACFSLRSGETLRPPALNPLSCWRVEREGDAVRVREKLADLQKPRRPDNAPTSIVIIGGGAAGNSAAETLRHEGYDGPLTVLSADAFPPCDRPNLSKDYLAGEAPEEWIPLRPAEFYRDQHIDLRLNSRVVAINSAERSVALESGERLSYGALLIATGADPIRLQVPGADLPHVHYLRSLADSRAVIAGTEHARRATVIGASFIGLEVAASLRARNLDVDVVAPETIPMERILGREIGDLVRALHEAHGVRFHLGATVTSIDQTGVTLSTSERLESDLVVAGVGVRPATGLAETAGLAVDRGIKVDEFLETSIRGVYAAGDLARWPDPHTGENIRVEHWVVAERQGQTAARNMLGQKVQFDAVPFFWSMHYDVAIRYAGHAEHWDKLEIDGKLEAKDCKVSYLRAGGLLAVATIGRDLENLRAELALERWSGQD